MLLVALLIFGRAHSGDWQRRAGPGLHSRQLPWCCACHYPEFIIKNKDMSQRNGLWKCRWTQRKSETKRLCQWPDLHLEGTLWTRARCAGIIREGSPSFPGIESEQREGALLAPSSVSLRTADSAVTVPTHHVRRGRRQTLAPPASMKVASKGVDDTRTVMTLSNVPWLSWVVMFLSSLWDIPYRGWHITLQIKTQRRKQNTLINKTRELG